MDRQLVEYLPPALQRVREFQGLTSAEQPELSSAWDAVDLALANQFISTATEYGLSRWESLLELQTRSDDGLDFRRDRIRNRLNLQRPFHLGWLYERLDALMGPGKWTVEMDYSSYTLYIEADIQSQSYVQEVSVTLNTVKPCNIVYINRPLVPDGLRISEVVRLTQQENNYRLGQWALGKNPFAWEEEKEVVKMTAPQSIQPALTEDVASFLRDHVTAARINGAVTILALAKIVKGGQLVLTYPVSEEQAKTVTQLELLDDTGKTLVSSTVFVPIAGTVVFKHSILTEGGQ